MTDTGVVYRPPIESAHKCAPPMRCATYRSRDAEPLNDPKAPTFSGWRKCTGSHNGYGCIGGEAAEPIGTVWRCDCGIYWTVWLPKNHPESTIFIAYRPEWRRSGWLERRRARKTKNV